MTTQQFQELFSNNQQPFTPVIAPSLPSTAYTKIDLSITNKALDQLDLTSAQAMENYIEAYCKGQQSQIAYGGYLEIRNLYQRSTHFTQQDSSTTRNIHLGVDFWAAAGTPVVAPLSGLVHSFQDNKGLGDYGPTIILEHEVEGLLFYSLYGHLSVASLQGLEVGQAIGQGQVIGTLGEAAVNGDYAPHLHVQLILDVEGKQGDYPGVCSAQQLEFYQQNCPNPVVFLGVA